MRIGEVLIGSTWSALERRKYAGLIQNKILDKYNVKTSATSQGDVLFVKSEFYDKLKKDIPATKAGNLYLINVNKTLAKKLDLL